MNLYIILFIIGLVIIIGAYISVKSQFEHFANAYEFKDTEYKVSYPDKNEIKDKICSNNYFKFFKLLDSQARKMKFTFEDFQNVYNSSIKEITQQERKGFELFYKDIVEKIPSEHRHQLLSFNLKMVKLVGVENGFPHTHSDLIIFDQSFYSTLSNYQEGDLKQNMSNAKTLIHEILHTKQREQITFYDTLFNQWGFQSISYNYLSGMVSKSIVSRIRLNPDELPDYRFWVWKNQLIPMAIYNGFDVSSISNVLNIGVKWLNDDQLMSDYKPLNNFDNYNTFFGIKNNVYHPNEILAEYQSIYFIEIIGESVSKDILESYGYKLYKEFMKTF
jgi:hypothetical protein